MTTIAASEFVKRQTPESRYSHFEGSWEELAELVETQWNASGRLNLKPGYRDGVLLVIMPPERFFSSIVATETVSRFEVTYEPRQPGEKPVMNVFAYGRKTPAKYVEIVLYHHDVLEEDGDASTDTDWEIVSINASPISVPVPMNNTTRARNVLHEPGGTDPQLEKKSKEELIAFINEFAEATMFWSRHTMVQPEDEKRIQGEVR